MFEQKTVEEDPDISISVIIFKFFKKMSPQYMSEIFHPSHSRYNTRMATLKLDLPLRQSCLGQKPFPILDQKHEITQQLK